MTCVVAESSAGVVDGGWVDERPAEAIYHEDDAPGFGTPLAPAIPRLLAPTAVSREPPPAPPCGRR